VARRKADRAKDENGNIKPPVHRKGESQGAFSIKDTRYKAIDWHSTVKTKAWHELANRGTDMKPKNLLHEYHEGKGKEAPAIRKKNDLIRKANAHLNNFLAEKGETVASLSPEHTKYIKKVMLGAIKINKVPIFQDKPPNTKSQQISNPISNPISQSQEKPFESMDNMRAAAQAEQERQATPPPQPQKRTWAELQADAKKKLEANNAQRVQQARPAWNSEYMKTLHKRKMWSELTPEERQAVRKLSVNVSEFEYRQDYLDMKRHFKAGLDRGR